MPQEAAPPEPTARPGPRFDRVWLAAAVILAAAGALAAVNLAAGFTTGGPTMHWLMLLPGFALAEIYVVNLHFHGREAQSFTLSDLPLVLGLLFCPPAGLLAARLGGAGLALLRDGGRLRVKAAYNIACFALDTALAFTVFGAVLGDHPPLHPVGWLAVLAAVLSSGTVSVLLVMLAVTLTEGAPDRSVVARHLGTGAVISAGNVCLGLVAALAIDAHPGAALLVLLPTGLLYLAYRAYHADRRRAQSLQLLQITNRRLQSAADRESAIGGLLTQLRAVFAADRAELLLYAQEGQHSVLLARFDPTGEHRLAPVPDRPGWAAGDPSRAVLLPRRGSGPYGPVHGLPEGSRDAMIVPLLGESSPLGLLLVADRSSETATFDAEDLSLLRSLADLVSAYCDNDRLERALAQVSALQEELTYRAYHDPLTGLDNRRRFGELLDDALVDGPGSGPVGVLLLDLDDFKDINDSLGHDAGDAVLLAVADRLTRCLPTGGTAARLGGDEFALLLPGEVDEVVAVGRAVLEAFGEPVEVGGRDVPLRGSVGAAAGVPGDSPSELMRQADTAMYHAKRRGKGAVEAYRPELSAAAVDRLELSTRLQHALDYGELVVHYQPTYLLGTGRVHGVEALVRWAHPDLGLVPPMEFIPLAEETGQIVQLGRQVLRTAVQQCRQWQLSHAALADLGVSVNVSNRQLEVPGLVEEVRGLLAETRLPPGHLTLEVTERVLLADDTAVMARIEQLKALGVRFAIDDFGTGYSSLGYLARLPVDAVKLDKSFVDGIDQDRRAALLARAVVELGRGLGLQVVAEGIERASQLSQLARWGCAVGQGYHFARPADAEQTERLLVSAAPAVPAPRTSGQLVPE
jgi:diguanylate cyclase (GGDEF)-like protein